LQDGGVVILAGATKGSAANHALVHGTYDLIPELYNGRVLFRKRDNKTVWLRFTTTKNWIVSSAADKEANNDVGYAFAPGSDSALPSVSGWRIHDAGGFVGDEGISVTLSDALKIAMSVAVSPRRVCVCSWNIFIWDCTAASVDFVVLVLGCSGRLDSCRALKIGTRVDQEY